jgi:hypothetical protein
MIQSQQFVICDICRLLDYSTEQKLCGYCPMCDAFICEQCSTNWPRRIKAAIKRKLEPGFKGDPQYTSKITEQGEWKGESHADHGANA